MGNFSKDPQNKLQQSLVRHYVGVRLQQGVPIVDADWNEMEDLRRWELWSLLKWFVGDGVPENNDGFRIAPVSGGGVDTIILKSKKAYPDWSSVTVNRTSSTAADALGFGPQNYASGRIIGSAPARLTSDAAGTFPLDLTGGDKKLVIKADDFVEEEIVFSAGDPLITSADNVPVSEVLAVLNAQAQNVIAVAGQGGDFVITGGDGTSAGAGRCLAGGWEALNEANLKYTSQALYDNATLSSRWGVAKIAPLKTPPARRTDTVYLDVWEREVSSEEDSGHMIDARIGLETSMRIKREWAVRVREDSMDLPAAPAGHVFFRLAAIVRDGAAINIINMADIRDGRKRTGLLGNLDLDKTELGNRIKIMRNAIEHLSLRSTIDSVPAAAARLPNVAAEAYSTPNGFARLVDRFQTTAGYNDSYHTYFAVNDGTAAVTTQILADTEKPITEILVTDKSRILGSLPVTTTVDVSLDGGNTFGLVNQPLNRDIDTQALPPNGERYQLVLRFNLPSTSNAADVWTTRAPLPAARSHLAAVTGANGRLYAIGGNSTPSTITTANTVFEYDDASNAWSTRTPMAQEKYCAAAAIRSFRIYAVGGSHDGATPLGDVEEYEIKNNVWTTLAACPMATAREQLALAAISDERIYAIGGLAGSAVNLNEEFNPVTKTWQTKQVLPANRQGATASVNSLDQILLFGGIIPSPTPIVGNLDKYNPFNNTWSSLAAMSAPRSGHAGTGVSNDFVYAFGGFGTTAQTPTNTSQEYDPLADTWKTVTTVPAQVKFACAAAVRDAACILGGWNSANTPTDGNLQYKPLLTTKVLQSGFGVEFTTSE